MESLDLKIITNCIYLAKRYVERHHGEEAARGFQERLFQICHNSATTNLDMGKFEQRVLNFLNSYKINEPNKNSDVDHEEIQKDYAFYMAVLIGRIFSFEDLYQGFGRVFLEIIYPEIDSKSFLRESIQKDLQCGYLIQIESDRYFAVDFSSGKKELNI